jgi:hypothetical protein
MEPPSLANLGTACANRRCVKTSPYFSNRVSSGFFSKSDERTVIGIVTSKNKLPILRRITKIRPLRPVMELSIIRDVLDALRVVEIVNWS